MSQADIPGTKALTEPLSSVWKTLDAEQGEVGSSRTEMSQDEPVIIAYVHERRGVDWNPGRHRTQAERAEVDHSP